MANAPANQLLQSLPTPLREDGGMRDFLRAFESILLEGGLETQIAQIAQALDPAAAPLSHLRWIAGWLGLAIDADYPTDNEAQYRQFVARTLTRYRQRGTLQGMAELLEDFTGAKPEIFNDRAPHSFVVLLKLDGLRQTGKLNELERLRRVAHALIQREKPAHTRYELRMLFQTFQVANLKDQKQMASPARVGKREGKEIVVGNMMLGQAPANKNKPEESR